jgi:hypothetical protein
VVFTALEEASKVDFSPPPNHFEGDHPCIGVKAKKETNKTTAITTAIAAFVFLAKRGFLFDSIAVEPLISRWTKFSSRIIKN